MKAPSLLVAAALLGIAAAHATELVPLDATHESEGTVVKRLEFPDDPHGIASYEPPVGWAWSGDRDRLILVPETSASTMVVISRRPAAKAEALPDPVEERLAWVRARAPRDAEAVDFIAAAPAGLQIDGTEPLAVSYQYRYFGEDVRVTLWLLNRASEQLQFQLTSPAEAHAAVAHRFRRSLFTLNWGPRGS